MTLIEVSLQEAMHAIAVPVRLAGWSGKAQHTRASLPGEDLNHRDQCRLEVELQLDTESH